MYHPSGAVIIRCWGHPTIRGTHRKTLELTRSDCLTAGGTCIVGVRAEYDPQALKVLRGPVLVRLRSGAWEDCFRARISPFFQDDGQLVFRKSGEMRGRTLAYEAEKGALDLRRDLVHNLQSPDALLTVTLEPDTAVEEEGASGPETGVLYVVSMPIGNEGDVSSRALRTLASVDLVAAEDTRVAASFLKKHGLRVPLVSYHDFNEDQRSSEILRRLEAGSRIALISDAGTPGCSDPGYRIVASAAAAGIPVSPVPGPSALLAALAASGLSWDRFTFLGFLPRTGASRRAVLAELRSVGTTLVFYEAPHRLLETLEDIALEFPSHRVCVARELTKTHEEFLRGTAMEVREILAGRPEVLGECVVVLEDLPARVPIAAELPTTDPQLTALLRSLLEQEVPLGGLSRSLADAYGHSRKLWYSFLVGLKAEGAGP